MNRNQFMSNNVIKNESVSGHSCKHPVFEWCREIIQFVCFLNKTEAEQKSIILSNVTISVLSSHFCSLLCSPCLCVSVEREVVQKRTFTRWMNLHLEKVCSISTSGKVCFMFNCPETSAFVWERPLSAEVGAWDPEAPVWMS